MSSHFRADLRYNYDNELKARLPKFLWQRWNLTSNSAENVFVDVAAVARPHLQLLIIAVDGKQHAQKHYSHDLSAHRRRRAVRIVLCLFIHILLNGGKFIKWSLNGDISLVVATNILGLYARVLRPLFSAPKTLCSQSYYLRQQGIMQLMAFPTTFRFITRLDRQ